MVKEVVFLFQVILKAYYVINIFQSDLTFLSQ